MKHLPALLILLLCGCSAPETAIKPAESSVVATVNEVRPIKRTRTTRTVKVDPPVIQVGTSLEAAK